MARHAKGVGWVAAHVPVRDVCDVCSVQASTLLPHRTMINCLSPSCTHKQTHTYTNTSQPHTRQLYLNPRVCTYITRQHIYLHTHLNARRVVLAYRTTRSNCYSVYICAVRGMLIASSMASSCRDSGLILRESSFAELPPGKGHAIATFAVSAKRVVKYP